MATGAPFTDDVRRFILTSIPSVPYLEAMLLLREHPDIEWNSPTLAQRLYLSEKAAADLLSALHAAGVIQQASTGHRYAPVSDDLREKIDHLAEVYSSHLIDVANLIHSKTNKKAQQFADAFKW